MYFNGSMEIIVKKQATFYAYKPFPRIPDMFIDVVLFPSSNYVYLLCRIL